jgi:hypothetical protein
MAFTTRKIRDKIRILDNMTGSYPSIRRTGTPDRSVEVVQTFDDTKTIIFADTVTVNYREGFTSGTFYYTGRGSAALGRVAKNTVEGTEAVQIDNVRRAGYSIRPFKELCLFEQDRSPFFLTGTTEAVIDDKFAEPLANKHKIFFDISSNEERVLGRYSKGRGDVLDPSGPFAGQNLTGFCYYNKDLARWEQIGERDPLTGEEILYDYGVVEDNQDFTQWGIISGTASFPKQFMSSPGFDTDDKGYSPGGPLINLFRERSLRETHEWPKIGTPTVAYFAPFATKYHATSSQTIKMSDYINHPFLVEKIVLDIPVRAQKLRRSIGAQDDDQDDYVFFIYRQKRRLNRDILALDTSYDISGSDRYIIASGSATFYLNTAWNGGYYPHNTPAFSQSFSLSAGETGQFTGSLKMNIVPAVASAQFLGKQDTLTSDTAFNDKLQILNFWPGGTTSLPFDTNGRGMTNPIQGTFSGRDFAFTASYGTATFRELQDPNAGPISTALTRKTNLSVITDKFPIKTYDGRTFRPYGGNPGEQGIFQDRDLSDPAFDEYSTPNAGQQSIPSPYLLYPEDEIVFGFEANPCLSSWTLDNTYVTELTSSQMTIESGPACVVFYGSILRDEKPIDYELNQQLTTDSVHEVIHEVITDQSNIQSRFDYTGSMYSRSFLGSIYGTRDPNEIDAVDPGVVSRSTLIDTELDLLERAVFFDRSRNQKQYGFMSSYWDENFLINGESAPGHLIYYSQVILGNNKINSISTKNYNYEKFNSNNRLYDTLMPSYESYLENLEPVKISAEGSGIPVYSLNPDGTEKLAFRGKYPYEGDLGIERKSNEKAGLFSADIGTPYNVYDINQVLFTRGWTRDAVELDWSVNTFRYSEYDTLRSRANRHGIAGTIPLYESVYFRTDHYGHMRDMLEQRPYTTTFNEKPTIENDRVGKIQGPVFVRFFDSDGNYTTTPVSSSNTNQECTSSVPYDDFQVRN